MLRVGETCMSGVAIDQRTAVVRRKQPLVRIDDQTVCAFDSGEEVAGTRCAEGRSTVRAIHVEPDTDLVRHIRHT